LGLVCVLLFAAGFRGAGFLAAGLGLAAGFLGAGLLAAGFLAAGFGFASVSSTGFVSAFAAGLRVKSLTSVTSSRVSSWR
jgi:hypothetical protein